MIGSEDAVQRVEGCRVELPEKPTSGRIAVKVINHLGDEVMKVFGVK